MESWRTRIAWKCCWYWHASLFQLIFLALPASFCVKMSIDSFSIEADYSFLNIKEFVLYIRIGILIDRNRPSAIFVQISWYSNLSSSKTTHLKFLLRPELTVIYFQMFIRWNNQWVCPLHWKIDELNVRKCSINNLILWVLRLNYLKLSAWILQPRSLSRC